MSAADSKHTYPGWEEALRELVAADKAFLECEPESVYPCLSSIHSALFKLHEILGSVAHPLVVPEDIGGHIMSLTEGWENFWLDYDMLSAIHSLAPVSNTDKILAFDIDKQNVVEDVTSDDVLGTIAPNLSPILFARRRLLQANLSEAARLVLVCARITCVDILLRQPKRSSIFLNSYFQTFPSFICQVASVGNLMANRSMSFINDHKATSIELMIAFASMSLLATVITETNHVTQGLSVLSANNPHSGILANLINTCLSSSYLAHGSETFMVSKAAVYLLSSSIQTARHPGSVGNATFIRKILEALVNPVSDSGVTHACCVCLEVSIESTMNGFTLLFRDLEAFDKFIDRAAALVEKIRHMEKTDENTAIVASSQKAISSIFSLLRLSFQTQEIHVGVNLHEKLSAKDSQLTKFFISVIRAGSAVLGKNGYNGCLTLIGNVMADDPLIISTFVDCGIADALIDCATDFAGTVETHPEILSSIFVAICALHLHESGAKKIKDRNDCLTRMLVAIAADEWKTSLAPTEQGKTNLMGYVMNEENRIIEDIGMVVGQSCDDINRNTNGWGEQLVQNVIQGLDKLVSDSEAESIGTRVIPALRMLYGGVLAISDAIDQFVKNKGMDVLIKILSHPKLDPGVVLKQVPNTNRAHPLASVFKMIGQRGGKDKPHQWQQPLGRELHRLISSRNRQEPMNEDFFSRITTICSMANVASTVPSLSGNTSDTSSGPLVLLVSQICSLVPDLLSFYIANRENNETVSAGWIATKNFLTTVAKNANSIMLSPRSIVGKGEVGPSSHLVCRALGCMLTRILRDSESGSADMWTETVDVLVRLTVEDRTHSVRPLTVLELYKSGGVHEACKLLHAIVKSGPSALEAFFVFFERITSHKRFTNASITNSVFNEDGLSELNSLVTSICAIVGETCDNLFQGILATENLSSTASTAVMKIFSHAVTMVEIEDGKDSGKRSVSPARKRARGAAAKTTPSEVGKIDLSKLAEILGSSLDETIRSNYMEPIGEFVFPEIPSSPSPFVTSRQVSKISKSIAQEFVVRCVSLGDKGNCEMQAAELMNRHAQTFSAISIRPKGSKLKDNSTYLFEIATEYSFEKKSRTACAILGSRLTSDSFKDLNSEDLNNSVSQMMQAILAITSSDLLGCVSDSTDWLGPLIAMIHPSVIAGVFGGLDLSVQKNFIQRLFEILEIVGDEKVANRSCQAIVHACLPVLSSLVAHRENAKFCIEKIPILLGLPSKCRTAVTAPLVTEILMKLVNSDLWVAVRLSKEIDAFTLGGERSVEDFSSNEIFVSAAVTDAPVFEQLCAQILRRKSDDRVVRVDEQEDEDASSSSSSIASVKEYDFSVFDGSIDTISVVLDKLVDLLVKSSSLVDKTNCAGLGDLISAESPAYPLAITTESALLMITAVLSEVATIREVDERYIELQTRILGRLIGEAGCCLIANLSSIEEDPKHETKIGTNEKIFKLMKVWLNTINRCSPWMSLDVLGMIADELVRVETEGEEPVDAAVLRTYAYSGLVFMLSEGTDISLQMLEKLIPLLAKRLKAACKSESHLCRFDTQHEFQALFASLYLLIKSLKGAAEAARVTGQEGEDNEDDDAADGSSENSSDMVTESDSDDLEIVDEVMGSMDDDGIEDDNDEDDHDDSSDEDNEELVFVNDGGIGGGSMEDDEDDSEGVLDEGGEGHPGSMSESEDEEDMDNEDDEDDDEGYEDWDEDDWWEEGDGYHGDEAEWEESDEDEDGNDVMGEAYLDEDEVEIGNEVAELIGNEIFSSGLNSAVPIGSPISGPSPAPTTTEPTGASSARQIVAPASSSGFEYPNEVVKRAREALEKLGREKLEEIVEQKEQSEEMAEESEDEASSKNSDVSETPDVNLSELSDEAQFAGLNNLSAEERLSIQQALAATGEEFDFDDDVGEDEIDEDMESVDEEEFAGERPNFAALIPRNGTNREVVIELPRGLNETEQANMITEAIRGMNMNRFAIRSNPPIYDTGVSSSGVHRSSAPKQIADEFKIDDELPKPEVADKLCSDSPQFVHKAACTWSEPVASCLAENIGSVSTRALLLRNQVPFKAGLDRVLLQLCFDPRSRNVVLSTLFDSLLNFIYPNRTKCSWSFGTPLAEPSLTVLPRDGVYDSSLHPLIDNALRHVDSNNPSQCRSVGSGRMINTITMILNHVPRARSWFGLANMLENRSDVSTTLSSSHSMFELHSAGRRTPEKIHRKKQHTPPHGGYTSSDGEGPLTRAVSAQIGSGQFPPRKTTPVTVAIKLLTSAYLQSSPSHSLILMNLIAQAVEPFPTSATDKEEQEGIIRNAVTEEAIQLLCDFLVENRNRLRHMPEFDRAVSRAGQVLVSLCSDVRTRELVRSRLLTTGSRLVAEIMERLNQLESFTAVPLVRLFRTAKEAFGTKRIAAKEQETFLDFAAAITDIQSLWDAVDTRLSAHNNLLIGMPSVAQQALAKRRGENLDQSGQSSPGDMSPADMEKPGNRIAALETISKLIPLVELFLSAHDITGIIGDNAKTTSERETRVKKSVMDFIERHRRPINSMVKSRPSILNRAFAALVAICPHMLDFDNKRQFFRAKLRHQDGDKRQPPPPQIKLTVRRDDVFRDSYSKLQVRTKDEWRGKLNITFQGEEGVDAGGLVREWFTLLAREIFNPNYALFTPASGRPSTFLINPASSVNPDHIHYFRFCGRFIGKAVYDNQRIDAYFVRSFYKHMLGKEVTWRDMETTDPDYFKNLNWILENDMTDVDYYSFTVEENEFGKLKVVELVPGGEDMRVTEENKHEYVRLVCEHKLTKGIQEQLKAFLQGFHELIPETIVGCLFDDKELEMLISGLPSIDIEDLKRNTDYVQYTAESQQIKWFWEALEKFTEDELAWFLQFVTGSTQVPLEGFKGLAGMHGPQRFSIHRIRVEDRLPTAHTCFNQLDLPEYATYEMLDTKLKQAVREGHSGFGFI